MRTTATGRTSRFSTMSWDFGSTTSGTVASCVAFAAVGTAAPTTSYGPTPASGRHGRHNSDDWGAGENCAFVLSGGVQVARLADWARGKPPGRWCRSYAQINRRTVVSGRHQCRRCSASQPVRCRHAARQASERDPPGAGRRRGACGERIPLARPCSCIRVRRRPVSASFPTRRSDSTWRPAT